MNVNKNVINEIERVKEETIEEINEVISFESENLNIEQKRKDMLTGVSYILEENNMLRQEDLVLDIVESETQDFLKK